MLNQVFNFGGIIMDKKHYESPEFHFQELFLFEGVANPCWAHHESTIHVWLDNAPRNEQYDEGEHSFYNNTFYAQEEGNNGCGTVTSLIQGQLTIEVLQSCFTGEYEKYWDNSYFQTIKDHENADKNVSGIFVPVHS